MAADIQRIKVVLSYVAENEKKIKDMTNYLRFQGEEFKNVSQRAVSGAQRQIAAQDALVKKQQFLANWSDKLKVNTRGVSQIMSAQGMTFDKLGNVVDLAGRKVRNLNSTMSEGKRKMGGFKMELLGVMFAGMALWRVTSGIIKAQLQLFGVTEMFGSMMTVLFLPVMTILAPILYNIMSWFMDLPEPVQKAISIFIMIAAAVGAFLMLWGQIGLGAGSIAKAFGFLPGLFSTIGGALAAITLPIALLIAAIVAIFIGMYIAWKENFMGMKDVVARYIAAVKGMWKAVFDFFKAIFKFFIAVFTGDWDEAWKQVKNIFSAFWEFLKNMFMMMLSLVQGIFIGIVRIVKWVVVDMIWGFFKWLYDKLVGHSLIPDMVNAMIEWFWKLPGSILDALKSILQAVYNWGVDFVKNIIEGIKSMGRKVLDAILGLFPAWMRSGIEKTGTITINIVKSITEKVKSVASKFNPFDDFLWRPGQAPISINPNDTLVGFKGAPPNLGGGTSSGEVTINQTNYISVSDKQEMERLIRDNNVKLVEEIKRQVAI